jgi:hypothetical protein
LGTPARTTATYSSSEPARAASSAGERRSNSMSWPCRRRARNSPSAGEPWTSSTFGLPVTVRAVQPELFLGSRSPVDWTMTWSFRTPTANAAFCCRWGRTTRWRPGPGAANRAEASGSRVSSRTAEIEMSQARLVVMWTRTSKGSPERTASGACTSAIATSSRCGSPSGMPRASDGRSIPRAGRVESSPSVSSTTRLAACSWKSERAVSSARPMSVAPRSIAGSAGIVSGRVVGGTITVDVRAKGDQASSGGRRRPRGPTGAGVP